MKLIWKPDLIRASSQKDQSYTALINSIESGFPDKRSRTKLEICHFWKVRELPQHWIGLCNYGWEYCSGQIPQKKVLCILHSAHQQMVGMKARANDSVYWSGINASILNFSVLEHGPELTSRANHHYYIHWLAFPTVGHFAYIVCADRLTGRLILYLLKPGHATTSKLIFICRGLFNTYGAQKKLSSDAGPPFRFSLFQKFLKTWCVKNRLSSVIYPHSNGRPELAVKTTKRIVHGNTDPQGSLDNNKAARAIL